MPAVVAPARSPVRPSPRARDRYRHDGGPVSPGPALRASSSAANSRMVSSIRKRTVPLWSLEITRLLSMSSVRISTGSPPSSAAGPQTASSSSSRQPPANTDIRANRARAGASRRPWLHAIASCSVRCRVGASRMGEAGRPMCCTSLSRMPFAPKRPIRAAASSMPSGSPSRRQADLRDRSGVLGGELEARLCAAGAIQEQAHRRGRHDRRTVRAVARQGEGQHRIDLLARESKGRPARRRRP